MAAETNNDAASSGHPTAPSVLQPEAAVERPILFSAPMIRALLDGSKTQTRRPVKRMALEWLRPEGFTPEFVALKENGLCPYGFAGDRLWVKETIRLVPDQEPDDGTGLVLSCYAADGELTVADAWPWKRRQLNSIHCPRGLSRITLEVTGVRVERLQDISKADAIAEGIVPQHGGGFGLPAGEHYHAADPRQSYFSLWEAINGWGSVEANPWLWVITFPRAAQP